MEQLLLLLLQQQLRQRLFFLKLTALKSKSNDVAQLSGDDAIVRYSALYGEKIADALSGRRLFGRTRRDTDSKATNIFSYDTVINLLQDQCATMTQDKALAFVMARHKR